MRLFAMEAEGVYRAATKAEVRAAALQALKLPQRKPLTSPQLVKDHLTVLLGDLDHEVFGVILLDSQNGVLGYHELFRGTLNQAAVYPREVVKLALTEGAAAVILTHNHPSGLPEASQADQALTTVIKDALRLIDVRVLDHIIVAADTTMSFAERGLL